MANLMIVIQTTQHNPNIKSKLPKKSFELAAQDSCPKSWDQLPEDYVGIMYENIKAEEISSPFSRSWYHEHFSGADLTFCRLKLSSIQEEA